MSTRSGASYTAGGSDMNSPTPPVDAAEVLDDPSLQHPPVTTNQPALLEVGGGPPDLAGRGDHLGPGQETPERGQPLPRDPDPVDPTPTPHCGPHFAKITKINYGFYWSDLDM